jgi:hypothetical protein
MKDERAICVQQMSAMRVPVQVTGPHPVSAVIKRRRVISCANVASCALAVFAIC